MNISELILNISYTSISPGPRFGPSYNSVRVENVEHVKRSAGVELF